MYDLIGDIHGHADALQQLLKKLGYSKQSGAYRHPERQAERHTFRTYAMASEPIDSDEQLPGEVIRAAVPYPEDAKPVFVGHYWLKGACPELLRRNVACVDWSVAKGGFLCAYQWDGEQKLDAGKFVWIY